MKNPNTHFCVNLHTHTEGDIMHEGDVKEGVLTMKSEFDFYFIESIKEQRQRNPKVWAGERINVSKDKTGRLLVNFRRTELTDTFDPCTFADEIFLEIERAKVELGL